MRNLLLVFIALFAFTAKGQINLEHTYNSNLSGYSENVYFTTDSASGVIDIYDLNHTLIRSCTLANYQPDLYRIGGIQFLSKGLFNTDTSNFEFILMLVDKVTYQSYSQVRSETGTLLSPSTPSSMYVLKTAQGAKLIVRFYVGIYKNDVRIYSLPGQYVGLKEQHSNMPEATPYPNPAVDRVNLPAQRNSEINVFDMSGKIVEQGKVQGDVYEMELQEVPSGMYIYNSTAGDRGRFIKQ